MAGTAKASPTLRTPVALILLPVLLFSPPVIRSAPAQDAPVSVTGIRLTRGDAVQCPLIRDDAGQIHAVSSLPADLPPGARVTVRGHTAISTRCTGPVIAVETATAGGETTVEPRDGIQKLP